jgi:hypothetical protein
MKLGKLGFRKVDRDAGTGASASIFHKPEPAARPLVSLPRLEQIRQVVVGIYVAARITGKAEREEAEEVLRVIVADGANRKRHI